MGEILEERKRRWSSEVIMRGGWHVVVAVVRNG